MKLLFIGQTDSNSLRDYYQVDKEARGISLSNVKDFLADKLDKKFGVFYTSYEDLDGNFDLFLKVCLSCDEVVYSPPNEWANESVKEQTRYFLNFVYQIKEVKNYSLLSNLIKFH